MIKADSPNFSLYTDKEGQDKKKVKWNLSGSRWGKGDKNVGATLGNDEDTEQ